MAKELTSAEKCQQERSEADRVKNENAKALSEEQRIAIHKTWKALQEVEFSIRETLDITIDNARSICKAETHMRIAFPDLTDKRKIN